MLSDVKHFFSPPAVEDQEMNIRARNMYFILVGTISLTILFLTYTIFFPASYHLVHLIVAITAFIVELGILILIRFNLFRLAGITLASMLWAAISTEVALYGGIRDVGTGFFMALIIIAGLVIGRWGGLIFSLLSILTLTCLAYLETLALLPKSSTAPMLLILLSLVVLLITAFLLTDLASKKISYLLKYQVSDDTKEARIPSYDKNSTNVASLTALGQSDKILQIYTSILQITGRAETEQDFLDKTTDLLMEHLELEHLDVYFLDQIETHLILQVSRAKIESPTQHSNKNLNVVRSESTDLLTRANKIHISFGNWNYYIDTPERNPDSTGILIVPLAFRNRLYGLMYVRISTQYQEEIKKILEVAADLVSQTIVSYRLELQTQANLEKSGQGLENKGQVGWEDITTGGKIGYSYDRLQLITTNETFPVEVTQKLLAGEVVTFLTSDIPQKACLVAPITLRDATIGVIGYDSENIDHEWQEDEKALLEAVASRVSLALENTRLVAEAQQRAERERMIGQITTRMRETLDIETILKTAVAEIRQSLGLREAEVRLQVAEESNSPEVEHE
jgi:GAF domain-containing protein